MTSYRRNVIVGATVLFALVVLGWMVLRFASGPVRWFAPPTMALQFVSSNAEGISEGSPVLYQGVPVGRVVSLARADNLREVYIESVVDRRPPLPSNVIGKIRAQSVLGSGAAINLVLTAPDPAGQLEPGNVVRAEYVGLEVLPPEYARLAAELEATARQLRESNVVVNLNQQVTKLGQVLEEVHQVVGNEQSQANIRATLENVRNATESATRVSQNLEKFTVQLQDLSQEASQTMGQARTSIDAAEKRITGLSEQAQGRIEQVGQLVQSVQEILDKINQGKGTAGMLVNDARLYESLVDTSRQLDATVADLRRLIEQWEQEGVPFKLGR